MTRGRPEPANRDKKNGQYLNGTKSGCFIATAVYGDFDAPQVVTLRRWRDAELSQTSVGRSLVSLYYFSSPPIARYLARSPKLAQLVRRVLDAFIKRLPK